MYIKRDVGQIILPCSPSEHKRKFREWRKKHYDEFFAVKKAREQRKKVNQKPDNVLAYCSLSLLCDAGAEGGGGGGGGE